MYVVSLAGEGDIRAQSKRLSHVRSQAEFA